MALRTGMSVSVLTMAGVFAWRGSWPWHQLEVRTPILVSESFEESADTLRPGETLSHLLARHNIRGLPMPGLPQQLSFDPRRLRAGMVFHFRQAAGDSAPSRILVRTSRDERLRFRRDDTGWTVERIAIPWRVEPIRLQGPIGNSLYESLDSGIPDSVLPARERVQLAWDLADVYAWQVDFTRDLRPGDRFTILAQRLVNDEGEVRFGRVLAGELSIDGRELPAFRFQDAVGREGYYDGNGLSLRRAFLLAPLQFRRISSRFSQARMHPILGTMRAHEGTDFAAPPGTPVRAAGDGTVTRAEWTAGYGYLVELRHLNGITTRYGHLEGFAHGIRPGVHVEQGEPIGFVGSTGLSTGPHLHYEFRINGVARDPRKVQLGTGEPVPLAERAEFDRERRQLCAALLGDSEIPLAIGAE
jgi:murein DD-endopeptidase MepM/ murein hydrolase activator NlpD